MKTARNLTSFPRAGARERGKGIILALCLAHVSLTNSYAYESLQGPTELLHWDKQKAYDGYTLFATRGASYLIDMEGQVVHTWKIGTTPQFLDSGNLLDASKDDPSGFGGFRELDWDGNAVWEYSESREGYAPHHDWVRIFNKKLNAYTTLYIANKSIPHTQAIAAGADPNRGSYDGAQMDAIVEIDMEGNVVWEWWFLDHVIQDDDPNWPNYAGEGKTVVDYPGRIDINMPGHPLKRDWLHCNSLDYNAELGHIVTNSVQGEFYVIDHDGTFVAGDPERSIELAAGPAGDFLYRFGDPARYGQGDPPRILENWNSATSGHKQIGGAHDVHWIRLGLPGTGHFLIFNNGQYLFDRTSQSSILEINGFLDSQGRDAGRYVNPPDAGYNQVEYHHDTHKPRREISKQVVWSYQSKSPQGFFSHIGSGAQRQPNGNTLICAMTEGHLFEVTPEGECVWEYINPVTPDGPVKVLIDSLPMTNGVFRAYRYSADHPALKGRDLTPRGTITDRWAQGLDRDLLPQRRPGGDRPRGQDGQGGQRGQGQDRRGGGRNGQTETERRPNQDGDSGRRRLRAGQGRDDSRRAGQSGPRPQNRRPPDGPQATRPSDRPPGAVAADSAQLTTIADRLQFTEGPVSDAEGNVFFADVRAGRIYRWSIDGRLSVVREDTGGANGLAFDRDGNLLACEGDRGRITATGPQGKVTVLAEQYNKTRFNRPNDLWVDPKGGVYFSDPAYGGAEVVQDGEHVYYILPDRSRVIRVIDDMVRPNGLVGTPDGKTLYVTDHGAKATYRYHVNEDGTLSGKTLFVAVGGDGMTLGREGNVYLAENGIRVFNPAGREVATIDVPHEPTNVCFGGKDGHTLFITARIAVYSLRPNLTALAADTARASAQPPDEQNNERPLGASQGPGRSRNPLIQALDADGDGVISSVEMENAAAALWRLDKNGDGRVSREELRPQEDGRDDRRGPRDDRDSGWRGGRNQGSIGQRDTPERGPVRDDRSGAPRQPWPIAHAKELDTNGDGIVSREEMRVEATQTFGGYDRNQDGKLTSDEYSGPGGVRSAMGGFVKQHAQELDANADGTITQDELLDVALRMFDKADTNRDGQLDESER